MTIIAISRGSFTGGARLAECLAHQLKYDFLSREELVEEAKNYGVSVDRLEKAMDRPPSFLKRLDRERQQYVAFVTTVLCERAIKGDLVYHGHAGHLLLGRIHHVLRVRIIADMEFRVKAAVDQLGISRNRAIKEILRVDDIRKRWTRYLHGVEWEDPHQYDIMIKLEYLSIPDACAGLAAIARLPDFQPTPASQMAMENLLLKSHAQARLVQDERTAMMDLTADADNGVVTVYCPSRHPEAKELIPEILQDLEGCKELKCESAQ